MPLWEEYKAEAKARGALAHEFYVMVSTPTGSSDAVRQALPDHLAYQAQQEANGTLFMAGPLSDETGTQMEGIGQCIYRTGSLEEARAIADNDPMHLSGARRYMIRRWLVNEGAITVSVSLSAQSVGIG